MTVPASGSSSYASGSGAVSASSMEMETVTRSEDGGNPLMQQTHTEKLSTQVIGRRFADSLSEFYHRQLLRRSRVTKPIL